MGLKQNLFVSVIVPIHNAEAHLGVCLSALLASDYAHFEVIGVDDASDDGSLESWRAVTIDAQRVNVFNLPQQVGPAAARNYGATKAKGEILFFVDADVVVEVDTVARIAHRFQSSPEVVAVFGSYDDAPFESNFFSQYKNLYHHFVHQQSSSDATTFWTGCGAIRREEFAKVGGFDARRYAQPSIEDIELGFRVRRLGGRIVLDKDLQVKHLKRWTLSSMVRTDIFARAIPWSRLLLKNKQAINDLNLRNADRISAALVGVALLLLMTTVLLIALSNITLAGVSLAAAWCCAVVIVWLNRELYKFFAQRKGYAFAAAAFFVQCLYYFYSSVAYVYCRFEHRYWSRNKSVRGVR